MIVVLDFGVLVVDFASLVVILCFLLCYCLCMMRVLDFFRVLVVILQFR